MSSRKLDHTRPAKTAAQRQRDQRARKRAGVDIFRLRLPREMIRDGLVEIGELAEWDDGNPEKLDQALHRYVYNHFRSVTRDLFSNPDLLNSNHEINRDSVNAGKGKPKTE
ncbi:hypothetical protein [Phyllobacterium chamaecytisi]|uniref:hypothetical protein n=1 Tax=Phyllobacterium chamaecytisi TaxID=2876082 RepID=UPI001CCE04F0|nr:hypothetical protein [Phyllobacterium sp. KW56]MBZ9603962.1 hypothetical protein [Phyllobacterium sp. KW56]